MKAKMKPYDRILDAALRVFRRHGFRRSSIEQVAEAAGLTRQALYHHFQSKEALFRAVIESLYEIALAEEIAAADIAAKAGGGLADILAAQVHARLKHLIGSFDGSPHIEELFSEHLALGRDLYQKYATAFAAEIATTITRVCRTQRLGLAKGMTADTLARCIEMAMHGAKSSYPSMLPADAFLADLDIMLRTLVAGAIVPPPRLHPASTARAKKSKPKAPGKTLAKKLNKSLNKTPGNKSPGNKSLNKKPGGRR
jgi:TetR/AcrR family acrAB operon transcriptional repressor